VNGVVYTVHVELMDGNWNLVTSKKDTCMLMYNWMQV